MPDSATAPNLERNVTDALAAHIGRLTADFVRADLIAQQQERRIHVLEERLAQALHDLDRANARLALDGHAEHPIDTTHDFGA